MANSITGINDTIISQNVLEGFVSAGTPLMAFSNNFSADAAKRGDTIKVMRTTAADAGLTKTTATDYTIQDADSDSISLTLGQPDYVSWGLDDVEVASSSVLNMERYAKQKGFQLMKKVLQAIWARLTVANYGAASFSGLANTFDPDDVADLAQVADEADWSPEGRGLIIKPSYYTALLKDAGIQDSSAFGGPEAIRKGQIPNLFGFNLYKSNLIPANGINLVGMICVSDAIGVAMRYLQPQEGNTYNLASAITDPETGMTIGVRDWYDNDSGVRKRVYECVYGHAVGLSTGAKLLVSA